MFVSLNDMTYENAKEFDSYKRMIELGNGLSLGQVCNITKLKPHIIQNWIKRSYIPHPIGKKYYTKHLARILLINSLRNCMKIEDIGLLMKTINGDVDDESDDIISEEKLYKMFSTLILNLKDLNKIDEYIQRNVKNKKLQEYMKIMVYAYIGSQMSNESNMYFIKSVKEEK